MSFFAHFVMFSRCCSRSLCCSTTPRSRSLATRADHIKTNAFQRTLLAALGSVAALVDPHRADMVATVAETTAGPVLERMRRAMRASEEGQQVLADRPRVRLDAIDMQALLAAPAHTFGHQYAAWLQQYDLSPETRPPVRFIADEELAYVMMRYREVHDFWHVLFELPPDVPGELALKAIEFAHTTLPSTLLSAVVGPLRLRGGDEWATYARHMAVVRQRWPACSASATQQLMCCYYERRFGDDIDELRAALGIGEAAPGTSSSRSRRHHPDSL